MYEAVFHTPSDFMESASEQHLSVYRGNLSAYPSMSRLSVFRALLNNELGIRIERSNGYGDWNLPKELEIKDGKREVEYYFHLVGDPVHLAQFDAARINHFYKMRNEWNDVVIVGAASESWFALHWYTTA